MKSFETSERLPDDQPVDPGVAQVFIFGMGRIGSGAYENICASVSAKRFWGWIMIRRLSGGTQMPDAMSSRGDATDPDFRERIKMGVRQTVGGLVLLSMK